jgi:hypothetical protein
MREWNVEREPRPSALLVVRPSLPEKPASCFTADEWADWQRSKIYLMSPLESEVATMRAVIDGFRPVLSRRWAAGRNRPGTSYSLCEPR